MMIMMFDFGDELIIESSKIPWLIWIQLLVTILFMVLLFGFSICSTSGAASTASTAAGITAIPPPLSAYTSKPSSSRTTKVEEIQPVKEDAGVDGVTIRVRGEDQDGREPPMKNSMAVRVFEHPSHPCNYIGLAKQTFLKCFGLDTRSESPDKKNHGKQD